MTQYADFLTVWLSKTPLLIGFGAIENGNTMTLIVFGATILVCPYRCVPAVCTNATGTDHASLNLLPGQYT